MKSIYIKKINLTHVGQEAVKNAKKELEQRLFGVLCSPQFFVSMSSSVAITTKYYPSTPLRTTSL